MKNVDRDVNDFVHSGHVYLNSNEQLDSVFTDFDFRDKNIFSVLGSGDQAFHLINRGARRVDLFDINVLTKYYFYLRIWMIKYLDLFYYNNHLSSSFINQLLEIVTPTNENEKDALYYWKKLMKKNIFNDYEGLIFSRDSVNVKKNYITDLERIKDYISRNDFNISNIDITGDIIPTNKYDYVILSNINEWLFADSYSKIWQYVRNIDDLLCDDGIAICSRLRTDDCDKRARSIFERMFEVIPIRKDVDRNMDSSYYPGYYLVRK